MSVFALGQDIVCDGNRYLNEITSTVNVETVKFGEAYTWSGDLTELYMDIYTPDGDTETNRPAIVFAFGGSFVAGSRTDQSVVDFCERYTRRGYVTAAIDYRLYDWAQGLPDSLKMMDEVVKAVADFKGATKFLRHSAESGDNPYGINPDKIFGGGISAGAVAALHAGYIQPSSTTLPVYIADIMGNNGGIEGDTDLPGADSYAGTSSELGAIISYAGALHRADFIEAGGPPVVSCHGDADGTVPYGWGFASVAGFPLATLQGSSMIHDRASSLGIAEDLYTVSGGGHLEWIYDEPHFSTYDNMFKDFLYNEATCDAFTVSNNDLDDVTGSVSLYPNPSSTGVNILVDEIFSAYDLILTDNAGRTIQTIQGITDKNYRLERNDLPVGIYHVRMEFPNDNFAIVNKRVVFQ